MSRRTLVPMGSWCRGYLGRLPFVLESWVTISPRGPSGEGIGSECEALTLFESTDCVSNCPVTSSDLFLRSL
jgi:hypothetical protein